MTSHSVPLPCPLHKHSWKTLKSEELQCLRGFPGDTSGKEPNGQCRRCKRCGFDPWVGKIPWRRAWQPTPVSLPRENRGQRSLAVYSPWGCIESDTTEVTSMHTGSYRVHVLNQEPQGGQCLTQRYRLLATILAASGWKQQTWGRRLLSHLPRTPELESMTLPPAGYNHSQTGCEPEEACVSVCLC